MFAQATLARGCALRLPVQSDTDSVHLLRAADIAEMSMGLTAPHANSGCVIVRGPHIVGEGFLYGQGSKSAELQAVERAGEHARGGTAYLNLEPGDWLGDNSAVTSLIQAGVSRVVVGIRNPFEHLQGRGITALRHAGLNVDVAGEDLVDSKGNIAVALKSCRVVNAPLLYKAAYKIPFSVLKYAMTLDGKIAASSGHAAWVSGELSRARVFRVRAQSDAVIVGGNTVRRDNPSLTTRKEEGHQPVRIVMSRGLDLPEKANLWDISKSPTIVMTQKGSKKEFQKMLMDHGVEVVEFELLTPRRVMEYCYTRGFLQIMWECGGLLSAPAISSSVIHKVLAFIAPKIVGGVLAPTPVGELGMLQMTQALNLSEVEFEKVGPDMLVSGYLQPLPDLPLGNSYGGQSKGQLTFA
ncbi:hypothetical protein BDL97_04G060600 [Sphagnum fallax]|nr:hypothetical protein BDL97_04G060600 [Sphagnum fallax]KAH8964330.1 hypothetical protein BDL97_04G060600 [Sphagnum fallax]KAH8964331.1 hypothetical protein BDL97_04G060600 [Sphagnum fallax]